MEGTTTSTGSREARVPACQQIIVSTSRHVCTAAAAGGGDRRDGSLPRPRWTLPREHGLRSRSGKQLVFPTTCHNVSERPTGAGRTCSVRLPRGRHRGRHGLVPLHVLLPVRRGAEGLLAERALVGLHAHVRGHVPGEAAVGGERRGAHAAAERLDPCDDRNTVSHRTPLPEHRRSSEASEEDTSEEPQKQRPLTGPGPILGRGRSVSYD